MTARVKSCCLVGIDGHEIIVEADMAMGLPSFEIVGLPDTSVKESRERVRTAIKNCGLQLLSRKFIINLAPANLKKEGSFYDLPIAISVLISEEQLNAPDIGKYMIIGELSLSGEVRGVSGVLSAATYAKENGIENVMVPEDNAFEASLVGGINVYGVKSLHHAVMHLSGREKIEPTVTDIKGVFSKSREYKVDFNEVKGQYCVKRALELAAAGGHNCLVIGTPGSGKTMMAMRLPTIMPDLTVDEALEVTKIHSIVGQLPSDKPLIATRPFRNPHHTTSTASLVGGGSNPRPGELSLAHNGVLFLDELPEYRKDAIEVMRQPLEDGKVTIARVQRTITYPCRAILIAAMNPCKCGYYGDPSGRCRCHPTSVRNYLNRISGPLLDRIDIQIESTPVKYEVLKKGSRIITEDSAKIKERVEKARKIQLERYQDIGIYCNGQLTGGNIEKYCILDKEAEEIVKRSFDSMGLSARAHSKLLKISRTIADMRGGDVINQLDMAEAIAYRSLDKKYWDV